MIQVLFRVRHQIISFHYNYKIFEKILLHNDLYLHGFSFGHITRSGWSHAFFSGLNIAPAPHSIINCILLPQITNSLQLPFGCASNCLQLVTSYWRLSEKKCLERYIRGLRRPLLLKIDNGYDHYMYHLHYFLSVNLFQWDSFMKVHC